jgi:isopentenyl-diphosphate delta-isomerase
MIILTSEIGNRKIEHVNICLNKNVQSRSTRTGFGDVSFIHRSLPEMNVNDIDLSVDFFDHKLSAPIIIEAMTGGTRGAIKINASLAEAAENLSLAMGVGSQRAAIENPKLKKTFKITRDKAPNIFLMANLGASELASHYGVKEAENAVNMIDADALVIHLNPLQEAIQPEGNPSYEGVVNKLEEIANVLSVPVIVKETGAGISAEDAKRLEKAKVQGIDVSGVGGTSWSAVEYYRIQDLSRKHFGELFWDWGIPTVASIVEVSQSTNLHVIASGGIRNGIQIAKSLALGADTSGLALPLLKPAVEGKVIDSLKRLIEELRITSFLVGVKNISELKSVPLVITGKMADWLTFRGFKTEIFRRK